MWAEKPAQRKSPAERRTGASDLTATNTEATDKPNWWQNRSVYVLAGLLLPFPAYVDSYFTLADSSDVFPGTETRAFKYDALRIAFGPAAWVEAKIRGKTIFIDGSTAGVFYYPDGELMPLDPAPPPLTPSPP
jgi:hypothetical protein